MSNARRIYSRMKSDQKRALIAVEALANDDMGDIVEVLCDSFADYPVLKYVLKDAGTDFDSHLRLLILFFVEAPVFRNEWMIGIRIGSQLVATAVISKRDGMPAPATSTRIREGVWTELGESAYRRYSAFGAATDPFEVDWPHLHINMIGIRQSLQGSGYGRLLMEYAHHMSAADPHSGGITLTTENEDNISFYKRLGYEVVGSAVVSDDLTSWGFYRENGTND